MAAREEVELEEVRILVEELSRENPKATAVVQADSKATTRYLVEVVEQIRAAGVADVAVSTDDV